MDIDFSEKLKGFDEIWQRVLQHRPHSTPGPEGAVKPARSKAQSRAKRFDPGRR